MGWIPTTDTERREMLDAIGVPNVAALMDKSASGQTRVFVARLDGFVNVFDLDGKQVGLLNAEGPIVGMAMLKNRRRAG